MKGLLQIFAAAFLFAGCLAPKEVRITTGTGPKISPDGRWLLFQREEAGRWKVGLFDLKNGGERWVKSGPGDACHPAWGPGENIAYTYSHETESGFAARKAGKATGYNLYVYGKSGARVLTSGRVRDYAVSYSPVTETYYYTSTAFPCKNDKGVAMFDRTGLFALKDEPGAKPVALYIPQNYNSGIVSASLSPDGTRFVWACRPSFWSPWRIEFAAAANPAAPEAATPETMAAYAPTWAPDGKSVAFTGFADGDGGWGVWIMDVKTRELKRICEGRNPCFSPDGQSFFYDRDGSVYRREIAK